MLGGGYPAVQGGGVFRGVGGYPPIGVYPLMHYTCGKAAAYSGGGEEGRWQEVETESSV